MPCLQDHASQNNAGMGLPASGQCSSMGIEVAGQLVAGLPEAVLTEVPQQPCPAVMAALRPTYVSGALRVGRRGLA